MTVEGDFPLNETLEIDRMDGMNVATIHRVAEQNMSGLDHEPECFEENVLFQIPLDLATDNVHRRCNAEGRVRDGKWIINVVGIHLQIVILVRESIRIMRAGETVFPDRRIAAQFDSDAYEKSVVGKEDMTQ